MRRLEPALCALGVIALTGCATSALEMAPEDPGRAWTPATTAGGEIVPGEREPVSRANYVLPSNPELAKVPAPPQLDAARAYSLAELIDIAETKNPLTRIAWNEARRAALAAGIAESAYLPRITASAVGAYERTSGQDTTLGTGITRSNSGEGTISVLSLNWLLFDFGERSAVVEAAKQVSVISNVAFTAAHQQVIYDVSIAFYTHAAARARVATADQSLKDAEAVEAAAEARHAHEIGTVIEVAQARQATAQARLVLVQATGSADDAYIRLISALGISPLTKLRIADPPGRELSPDLNAPIEGIVSEALARRPDMLSAYAAEKASRANVEAAEAEFLPKFFVSATGAYNSGSLNVTALPSIGQQNGAVNISGAHFNGSVLAGVTVPLYDGGTRSALLMQAEAGADRAEANLARIRNAAVREIVISENALRTSLSACSASTALVLAAQTTFDAALDAYRNGVGSSTDVTIAEAQLLQARNATTDSRNTALSAAATLAFATGALGTAPQ